MSFVTANQSPDENTVSEYLFSTLSNLLQYSAEGRRVVHRSEGIPATVTELTERRGITRLPLARMGRNLNRHVSDKFYLLIVVFFHYL